MPDDSRYNTTEKLLVPAWDKALLDEHGPNAVPVIPDMGFLDEDYNTQPVPYERAGMFRRRTP